MKDLEAQTGNSCYNYNTTTSSILQEKQLEEAAENYIIEKTKPDNIDFKDHFINFSGGSFEKDCWISGAKSETAKQYWFSIFEEEKSQIEKRLDEFIKNNFDGKPSYSEEEIFDFLWAFRRDVLPDGQVSDFELRNWFDQNKRNKLKTNKNE